MQPTNQTSTAPAPTPTLQELQQQIAALQQQLVQRLPAPSAVPAAASKPKNPYIAKIHGDHEIQTALRSGDWEPHVRNRYLALLQLSRGEEINIPKVNAGKYHATLTQRPKAPTRTLNTPAEQVGERAVPPEVLAAQRAIGRQRSEQFPDIEPMQGVRIPGAVSGNADDLEDFAWGSGEDDPTNLSSTDLSQPGAAPVVPVEPDVYASLPASPVDPDGLLAPGFVMPEVEAEDVAGGGKEPADQPAPVVPQAPKGRRR